MKEEIEADYQISNRCKAIIHEEFGRGVREASREVHEICCTCQLVNSEILGCYG